MTISKIILLVLALTTLLERSVAEDVDVKMQSNLRMTRRERGSLMSMFQGQLATMDAKSTRGKEDSAPRSENPNRVRGMNMFSLQQGNSIKMRRSTKPRSNMDMISLTMTMIDASRKVTARKQRKLAFEQLLTKRNNNNNNNNNGNSQDGRAGFGFFDGKKKKDKKENASVSADEDDDCLVSKAARNGRYNFFSEAKNSGHGRGGGSRSSSSRSKSKSKGRSRSRSGMSKSKSKGSSSRDFFCRSAQNSRHERLRQYVGDLDRKVDTYFRSRDSELDSVDIPLQWPHHNHN